MLPLWLAAAVEPLPPLTVTTTLVTPLGWEMMPRRRKEGVALCQVVGRWVCPGRRCRRSRDKNRPAVVQPSAPGA